VRIRKGFVYLRGENITNELLLLSAEMTSNQQSAISSQQEQETITSDKQADWLTADC
jgi:hypothetical protein